MTLLEVAGVSKTYRGGRRAVDGVDLRLGAGVLGLLGPNGAGKSSLMRVLATITRPTSGTVRFDGVDIAAHPEPLRRVLGYLPQDFGVYPHLTAREFLRYLAAVKGLSTASAKRRVDELLELVNLHDTGRKRLGAFSGGMRQRVGIAQALLNDPRVLIVDEPTAGLDPEERMRFRNLLGDLAADRIVILSTHVVSDVEAVADDIAVMTAGSVRFHGRPEELLRRVRGLVWECVIGSAELAGFRAAHTVSRASRTSDGVRVRVLSARPPALGAVEVLADLEDAYLAVVTPAVAPA